MEFLVNKTRVIFTEIPFEKEETTHILQIMVLVGFDNPTANISEFIEATIKQNFKPVGIMADHRLNQEGYAEIRVLQGVTEHIIDALQEAGLEVTKTKIAS